MQIIKVSLLIILFCLFNSFRADAQKQPTTVRSGSTLKIVSHQGTWDKTRDRSRAQFGGDNKLLNAHFASFSKGMITYPGFNGTAEILFRVDSLGKVDSIFFVKRFDQVKLSIWALSIIEGTSGKWAAAKVNGKPIEEWNTVWLHVFFDWNNNVLDDFFNDAEESIANENYKKAIKQLGKVLEYDELNLKAVTLQGQCYLKLDQTEKACQLWATFRKYNRPEINLLLEEHCNSK